MRPTVGTIGRVTATGLGALFLYGSVLWILGGAYRLHWSLGAVATLFYGYALSLGLKELRSRESIKLPINRVLGGFLGIALIGIAVAASISLLFETLHWASYGPTGPHTVVDFSLYYGWVLLDMLPELKLTESLGLVAPLQPQGVVAGVPLVAFRVLVIAGLLGTLKHWWERRYPGGPPPSKGPARDTAAPRNPGPP